MNEIDRVQLTLDGFRRVIAELSNSLTDLTQHMDRIEGEFSDRLDRHAERMDRIEERVRRAERAQY